MLRRPRVSTLGPSNAQLIQSLLTLTPVLPAKANSETLLDQALTLNEAGGHKEAAG